MVASLRPYEATVKRLTLEETLEAADGSISSGEQTSKIPYPKWVRMGYLKKRFKYLGYGYSDHSLMRYREIAFEEIGEYQKLCLLRYPEYWQDLANQTAAISAAKKAGIPCPCRKKLKPDILPLTSRQAELVEEVAEIMAEWQDHLLVREQLNKRHKQPD